MTTTAPPEDQALRSALQLFMHIMAGVYFGCAVYLSIITRSVSPAISILGIGAFCAVPGVAGWLRKRSAAPVRHLGTAAALTWCAALLFGLGRAADHLYMVNGSYYPTWLATSVTITPEQVGVVGGAESLCHDHGIGDYFQKSNGTFLRCGVWSGVPKTFYIENYREAYQAWAKKEGVQ
ncbi:TPA: hypothetical protein ACYSE6_006608 [Pseudomonas aeruginosa]